LFEILVDSVPLKMLQSWSTGTG